ncbi:MAG: hypothetical protein EVA48_02590 [Gammaproteobacteria bacterium]|jgi:hypothetical protein|nr:MAG: hypothetical protein EVA48_02590 [Gammaproteobacteria bacterium]|tara:strand:+ start:205 stop:393 length:189 start_codon:yes stop_codon:yes gene_type:complete
MQANRFHLGKVIEEINQNLIDSDLMKEATLKSNGIDRIVFAYYLILRSEQISSDEALPLRKF